MLALLTRRGVGDGVGIAFLYDDRPAHRSHPLVPATWLETDTGDGSIASTPADMAAYLRMLLNRGRGPNGRVLSEESFALLTGRVIQAWGGRFYGYGLANDDVAGRNIIGHGGGMVGYFAHLTADLDAGIGVISLINGPGNAYAIADAALSLTRAACQGDELPALSEVSDRTVIENATDYAGTYRAGEKTLTVVAEGDRLFLELRGQRVPLEARGQDAFSVDHPDFALFLLRFGRVDEQVVEAFYGSDWYVGERYAGPIQFEYPDEWNAYPGHYRSHNPWITNFRIVLRKGELALSFPSGPDGLAGDEPLVPIGDGRFRVGRDERGPEWISFDTVVENQTLRANLSGCQYYRFFTS